MKFTGILAGIALVMCAAASQAARPWPDSSISIVVFADQLQSGLSADQIDFAATHLAGTQKQRRSEVRTFRLTNPDFLCLHYQLAVGCGPADFISGDAWMSDWSTVDSQASWFLYDAATQRVHQTTWNWDVMDVTYTGGVPRTAFPPYWITSCVSRITSAEDDGVFADSFTQDAYSFGQCNPSHPWFDDVDACTSNWVPALEAFGSNIMAAFAADTNGFVFIPNLGGLITGWDPMNYGLGHGGMIEGFCFWDSTSPFDPADWQLQMTRALGLVQSNKILICQSYVDPAHTQSRMFALASYLLVKGSRTYINLVGAGGLEYYPEYTLQLGAALQPPAASVASLWNAGWGVYRRDYTNGIVLANPSASPVSIPSLGGRYRLAVPVGGGAVDAAGGYGGTLAYSNITSLVLPAYSGAVLLHTPWRFVAVGDSRGVITPVNTDVLQDVAGAIVREGPDLVLFCGDLVLGPADQAQFAIWTNAMASVYRAGIPVYPVRGNHDAGTGWIETFGGDIPDNGPAGELDLTYAVSNRDAVFLSLDQLVTSYRVNQTWVNSQLAATRQPHIMAFGHYPAFATSHADCLDDYPTNRNAFWNSLADAGARVYFAGHDHFYDHARLDDGNGNPADDLHQFVVGTSGAPLNNAGTYSGDNGSWVPANQFHEKQYGYVVGEVSARSITLTWKHQTGPGVYEAAEVTTIAEGYLWSPAADLGDGWKWLNWFGFFNDRHASWIYHNEHGWMWSNSRTTRSLWIYTTDLGWLYTRNSLYPWMYRHSTGAWLWYLKDSHAPRWFYNASSQSWEAR